MSTQEDLASYFESQSEWRAAIAEEYPEDDRNEHSAHALQEMASYVRGLHDDDPRIEAIRSFAHDDSLSFSGVEGGIGSPMSPAGRIGFGRVPVDCNTELTQYVEDGLADQIRELDPSTVDAEWYAEELRRLREIQATLLTAMANIYTCSRCKSQVSMHSSEFDAWEAWEEWQSDESGEIWVCQGCLTSAEHGRIQDSLPWPGEKSPSPMSDHEEWILGQQVEAAATEEQYLEFLFSITELARSGELGPEDRLDAIGQAITQAVGGSIVDATDWAQRVSLGLIGP